MSVNADRLPELKKTFQSGLSFDFILVNAVWMFVAPTLRERAFRKLVTLLKPRGVIALTLREGPLEESDRGMHPVSVQEIEQLARRHGAYVERVTEDVDFLGRREFRWKQIAIRLPDDGTGALPLVRRVVLIDHKSSTYKLGLLRVLCRIANGTPGLVRETTPEHVTVPLGIVALYWIKLYLPLLLSREPASESLESVRFRSGWHSPMKRSVNSGIPRWTICASACAWVPAGREPCIAP